MLTTFAQVEISHAAPVATRNAAVQHSYAILAICGSARGANFMVCDQGPKQGCHGQSEWRAALEVQQGNTLEEDLERGAPQGSTVVGVARLIIATPTAVSAMPTIWIASKVSSNNNQASNAVAGGTR